MKTAIMSEPTTENRLISAALDAMPITAFYYDDKYGCYVIEYGNLLLEMIHL